MRSLLYQIAKYMGDYSSISNSFKQGSFVPIIKRLFRRAYGRFASYGFKFFK